MNRLAKVVVQFGPADGSGAVEVPPNDEVGARRVVPEGLCVDGLASRPAWLGHLLRSNTSPR